MEEPQFCTQMPVPDDLLAEADTLSIQENPQNGHQITTGDQIQTGSQMFGEVEPAALALPTGSLWLNGRTLRVKILNGSEKIKSKVRQYASVWTQYANLKLDFVDSDDAEIRVNIDLSGSSWSYVGTNNLSIKPPKQTMNLGWLRDSSSEDEFSRVITHEFGHALGCIHEHQSPGAGIPWDEKKVYAYYERTQKWSEATTYNNMFRLYESTTTQFSEFDPKSIMLYAIPASLTKNGFSTGWNKQLSETDKSWIRDAYPAESIVVPSFNTIEVRSWDKPTNETFKKEELSKTYASPPTLALGLNWLDIANNANIRVKTFADNIATASADIHINSWADTTLYSAGCTWLEVAANDPDYQIGQFSTTDDHPWDKPQKETSRNITFPRAYASPPKVIVWLNGLDMANDKNWRINATATNIATTGFTIHLDTWADTVMYSASAAWIAYPADKANVTSGTYNTQDVRPWNNPRIDNSGRVDFPAGALAGSPKVLIALNSLDVDCGNYLRLKLSADCVSKTGMNWHIDSWFNTILYSAGASYIAFT